MAQPTNTFDTYDSVGIREDLADVIYNVDPSETPFYSKSAKTKAKNTLVCLLYTSPSPRDRTRSRMPSSA